MVRRIGDCHGGAAIGVGQRQLTIGLAAATPDFAHLHVAEQNRQLKTELDLTKQRLDLLEAELRRQQPANPAPRGTPETTTQDW